MQELLDLSIVEKPLDSDIKENFTYDLKLKLVRKVMKMERLEQNK